MMVSLVNKGNIDIRFSELLGGRDTTESTTHDDYMFAIHELD
jgi:hypothetical protein